MLGDDDEDYIDPPIRYRVQDKDNQLASHAALGRAVGWAHAKVRWLNKLIRDNNDGELQPAEYHYAMPTSGVSRIEIKTNPFGMWRVRIIGSKTNFGNFIWIPIDDEVGTRDQILVKGADAGGYDVTIEPDLVAGNIDWKGPLRTTSLQGVPLDRPVKDVLTWRGPDNRVAQHGGAVSTSAFVYKDGRVYAEAPEGRVNGAAIQTQGEVQLDVMITDEVQTSGGPQGIGTVKWNIWVRPAGHNIDPTPFDVDDNPGGWKSIALIDAPTDVAAERWGRTRTWYFNESGTQASAMLPVNELGDFAQLSGAQFDELVAIPLMKRNQFVSGIDIDLYPAHLRLVTLDIDAFLETAALTVDNREPIFTSEQVSFLGTCNFDKGDGSGTTRTRSEGEIISYLGGPRRVAVDYKGDDRVFATMDLPSGAGERTDYASNIQTSSTSPTTVDASQLTTSVAGWVLKVGALELDLVEWNTLVDATANGSSINAVHPSGVSIFAGSQPLLHTALVLWMDLRTDYVIWTPGRSQTNISTGTEPEIREIGTPHVRVRYNNGTSTIIHAAAIQAYNNSGLVTEYADTHTELFEGIGGNQLIVPMTNFKTAPAPDFLVASNCDNSTTLSGAHGFLDGEVSTREIGIYSMESVTQQDDGFGTNLNIVQTTAATDIAGNIAFSFGTYSGDQINFAFNPWILPPPDYVNFISGADFIDVMNQVDYIDPGPDGDFGTPDDIPIDPLSESGRADVSGWNGTRGAGTIKPL